MLKKIFLFLFCLFFLQNCGFTPMYSSNNSYKINIEKINFSGDWELNNYINSFLKKYKSDEDATKYTININTNYTKNSLTKDSTGKTITYNINIDANFNVVSKDINKTFLFKESFSMENFDDEIDQKNYERSNKSNLSNKIVNKFINQMFLKK